jgi:hypothetical protein
MESNKNDNNNNGIDNKHEQPQRSAQKRKLNEMTNDEDKPAEAAGEEGQECANSKKNREEGDDRDLEVCTYLNYKQKLSTAHQNGYIMHFVGPIKDP